MKIPNIDRKNEVEYFRIALNIAEISIDYFTADLVYEVFKMHKKKKGKMTVEDSVKIKCDHEQKWFDYQRKKTAENIKWKEENHG